MPRNNDDDKQTIQTVGKIQVRLCTKFRQFNGQLNIKRTVKAKLRQNMHIRAINCDITGIKKYNLKLLNCHHFIILMLNCASFQLKIRNHMLFRWILRNSVISAIDTN